MNYVFFDITWTSRYSSFFSWEVMLPGCSIGKRYAGGGSVMPWIMFFWEIMSPAIYVKVILTCTAYQNIGSYHILPFMAVVFHKDIYHSISSEVL